MRSRGAPPACELYAVWMNTKQDTGVPLLEYSRIEGWSGFASYLTSIGIETTADALQARRRRYGLPIKGGGTKGKPVYFMTQELDAWVKHLRGCTLQAWIEQQLERRDGDQPLLSGPPGRRPAVKHLPLPAFDLYVMTTRGRAVPEQPLRDEDGLLYAARDPAVFSDVAAMTVEDRRPLRAWRYYGMRVATATDLRGPAGRGRRKRAGRLVGAVVLHGEQLRWCRVPGPVFGLSKSTTTICLAAWYQRGFRKAVDWIKRHELDAFLLTWSRREEVEPLTLEEVPHPALDDCLL